jgi:hypothetical protein
LQRHVNVRGLPAKNEMRRGNVAKDWFDETMWPLEAAVIWVATGSRELSTGARQLALRRREGQPQKLPMLGYWLVVAEGRARELESVDGALYRKDLRRGWTPGFRGQYHPFDQAMARARQILIGKHATGRRGTSQRASVPAAWWKSAVLIDDRKLGLILRLPEQPNETAWQHIDVPGALFRRALGAKRGRHPVGLGPRAPHYGKKTEERLKTKKARADKQSEIPPTPRNQSKHRRRS